MNKYGLVFPGQGSQVVGMGKCTYENSVEARAVFEQADAELQMEFTKEIFSGDESFLLQTKNAQPAIYITSIALLAALSARVDINVSAFAGHSLGEFSAYTAANILPFAKGVQLVQNRGMIMSEAAKTKKGTMAAVLGIEFGQLCEICNDVVAKDDLVVVANVNCSGQLVISGTENGVKEVGRLAKEQGAKRVIPLKVSGGFHSPLMEEAASQFHGLLLEESFTKSTVSVYANYSSLPAVDHVNSLTKQMYSPVLWQQTIENMIADGVNVFIEIGPGKVLSGLIKRINKEVETLSVYDYESLLKCVMYLSTQKDK